MSPETCLDAIRLIDPRTRASDARKSGTCDSFHRQGKIRLIRIFHTIRMIDTICHSAIALPQVASVGAAKKRRKPSKGAEKFLPSGYPKAIGFAGSGLGLIRCLNGSRSRQSNCHGVGEIPVNFTGDGKFRISSATREIFSGCPRVH